MNPFHNSYNQLSVFLLMILFLTFTPNTFADATSPIPPAPATPEPSFVLPGGGHNTPAMPVVQSAPSLAPQSESTPQPVVANPQPVTASSNAETINELAAAVMPNNGRISFKFQNINVRTLIQLIAKISGQNFIISDAVKGMTTISLNNVTWQQALDTIMQTNGLAYKAIGKTIFVSTIDDITEKESKELQSAQTLANLTPLKSAVLELKYANAGAVAKMLKSQEGTLLTARGEVAVNSATNTVIIRDNKTNLKEIVRFIRRLDVPARQVEIEARIVDLDITYEAQLGVRFGLSNSRSVSGTWAGASQLADGVNVAAVNPIDERLNFNIPAAILSTDTTPASIGLALAHLGPVLLDLELSALEEEVHAKIISRPRVITANQQPAKIQSGQEIPYQEATSSGATSVDFKDAVLSLEIVPQITPDDKIILKIKATQDTVGPQLLVSQQTTSGGSTTTSATTIPATFGPPTINTQAVESYVMLNNHETLVIGGIFQLTKSNTLDRIPFFSDLPIIGNLFKHRGIKNQRTELLFFITPHIIEPHNQYSQAEYLAPEKRNPDVRG